MLLKDFYSIVSTEKENDTIITQIKINKNHHLYKGHFPGRPVTPGVILMQLFKEEAERIFSKKLQLSTVVNVKFMAIVDPNINEIFVLNSQFEKIEDQIRLKAFAEHNNTICLKMNSVYSII